MKIRKYLYATALLLLFIAIFIHLTRPVGGFDFFWHIATGKWIVENHTLPDTDPFTFTSMPEDPVKESDLRIRFLLRSYWLAQSIFYLIVTISGYGGVIVMRAFILTSAILGMFLWMKRYSVSPLLTLLFLTISGLYLSEFTMIKPQIFTFVFAVLLVYLLEGMLSSDSKGNRMKVKKGQGFLLPLLMLVWSNMHGGFILGDVIILIYLFSETVVFLYKRRNQSAQSPEVFRWFLFICIFSLLASLINPKTYHGFLVFFEVQTGRYGQYITENLPSIEISIKLYKPLYQLWFYLLAGIVVHIYRFRYIPLRRHLLFLFFGVIALKAFRFSVFLVLIEPLFLGVALSGTLSRLTERAPAILRKGIATPLIFIIVSIYLFSSDISKGNVLRFTINTAKYPSGAVKFIKDKSIRGNAFNIYEWGGYLTWELYPQVRVFHDGRGLVETLFFDAHSILNASSTEIAGRPEWKAILDAWGVDIMLIKGTTYHAQGIYPLLPALIDDPEWALVYYEGNSILFLRKARYPGIEKELEIPGYFAYNQVIAQAKLATRLRPFMKEPWVVMAEAYYLMGDRISALRSYYKAQRLDPTDEHIRRMVELLKKH